MTPYPLGELGVIEPFEPVVSESSLCRGIMAWWVAGLPNDTRGPYWRDLTPNVRSGVGVLTGTGSKPTWAGGGKKPGYPGTLTCTATSHRVTAGLVNYLFPTSTACSILLVHRKRDGSNRVSSACGTESATVTEQVGVHLPWSDGNLYLNFGGVTDGVTRLTVSGISWDTDWHWWAFTVGGGLGMRAYRDGVLVGSNAATPSRTNAGANWSPANWGNNVASSDLADYAETVVFDRALSASEVRAWYESSRRGHPELLRRWVTVALPAGEVAAAPDLTPSPSADTTARRPPGERHPGAVSAFYGNSSGFLPPLSPPPPPVGGTRSVDLPLIARVPRPRGTNPNVGSGPQQEDNSHEARLVRFTEQVAAMVNSMVRRGQIQLEGPSEFRMYGSAFVRTRPPGVTDDLSVGAFPGCTWVDTMGQTFWVCLSANPGTANWKQV